MTCEMCGGPLRTGSRFCSRHCANSRTGIKVYRRSDPIPRFWAKVDIGRADECWPWTARRDRQGYGQFTMGVGETIQRAHRISFTICIHPIPPGLSVLHGCDNPPCCNPDHFYLGTALENNRDTRDRGRRR